ncbi:hypothetical protein [Serratia marcescens]|uniref:hypothetical protein n=1 Tax=Serratia marcescens TaxID=615 RepID=UPI001F1537CD|nr:hypothetical protein [Serratia marcescens]
MTNKLSELSKPVAYDYQIASACIADGHNKNGKWVDWNNKLTRHCPPDWMMEEGKVTGLKLLYSQEYVSALLAELEAKDKRIAELERANQSQGDHINQQQDRIDSLEKTNTGLGRRLGDAEKRLATPIKIVNYDEFFICHVSGASDDYCKGWVDGRNAAARDVGKAGFTVEDRQ